MEKLFDHTYFSKSNDPFENLALENQLLLKLGKNEKQLLMYVNRPSIVMGRFQNPWIESNLSELKIRKVDLVRRQSGGGCVYHDLGNLNFCFLYGDRDYQKNANNKFMQQLLSDFDITTIVNKRSDIVLDVNKEIYKFSGSAFKQKKDRSFHHCTMLINSDLEGLVKLLDSPLKDLKSKSISSLPVPVKNLKEVHSEITIEKVVKQASTYSKKFEEVQFQSTDDYLSELKSWKWRLGETPLFEIDINLESELVRLEIRKAKIISATAITPKIQEVVSEIIGLSLEGNELLNVLERYQDLGQLLISNLKQKHLI